MKFVALILLLKFLGMHACVCLARTPPPKTFSVPRDIARRKKKQNKNNQNTWISDKRARLHEAYKLYYEKKFTRGDLTLNPCTLNFSLTKNFSHKSFLSLGRPPEPLKCLTSAVQKPL